MDKKNNIPEDISIYIIEFFEGKINDINLKHLSHWLNADAENLNQFNALKSIWFMSGKTNSFDSLKIGSDLEKVRKKIKWKRRVVNSYTFLTRHIAASLLFVLLTGGILGMLVIKRFEKTILSSTTTITVPIGAKSIIDLPDGSRVWINAGSKISYSSDFGKVNRDIRLVGEAYFSVKKNADLPFIVKTSDVMVKALGTKFNVKAYPEEKTITTTLEEGKILVTAIHKKAIENKFELKPHEMITFTKTYKENKTEKAVINNPDKEITHEEEMSKVIPSVKTELQTSWKDKIWIIEGKPLGELAPLLERKYNVVIRFEKNEIRNFKFTGKIQNETIEQIMLALKLSSPIKFNVDNNTISLDLNNSLLEKYSKNTNN